MPKPDDISNFVPQASGGEDRNRLFWTRGVSLTSRILAVNVIALMLLAASLMYLDSYRKQLVAERTKYAVAEAQIIADALAETPRSERAPLLARIGSAQQLRLRLYDARGHQITDSFLLADPSFTFADPGQNTWMQNQAQTLDSAVDFLFGAPEIPAYVEAAIPTSDAWPEVAAAQKRGETVVRERLAPDRTPVFTAAAPVGERGETLLTTRNATDITQRVRYARQTLAIIIGLALLLSILLSLFLARTIVQPLRALVRATVRVRLGRDREVIVPRLPERGDEIGLLARAVSDMASALRHRIDAVESFAADVAHELKNPLASLRSAIETLGKVDDPALRRQLTEIAAHDVRRIDRLVTEIADASRIDAQLSRTAFERLDILALLRALIGARAQSGIDGKCRIELTCAAQRLMLSGDAARLERVLVNLFDNAVSFSPPGGVIDVDARMADQWLTITVCDSGPGIPPDEREKVFQRFHSLRPEDEDFGSHSGLGLAIARTIVEAHGGTLTAQDRPDGQSGCCMVIDLPVAPR
ncbi:MAG: stimulus-sensing domain-containing protein [Novosphingobium sp.]